jgi:hypothetical protein
MFLAELGKLAVVASLFKAEVFSARHGFDLLLVF